jgi:predicted ArsR family transcriptional regulator
MEKYRSIKAFKDYNISRVKEISPLRILAVLKKSGGEMRKIEIADQLKVDYEAINKAVAQLLNEGVVKVTHAEDPREDMVSI